MLLVSINSLHGKLVRAMHSYVLSYCYDVDITNTMYFRFSF